MTEIINFTKNRIGHKKIAVVVELFLKTYRKSDFLVSIVLVGDQKIKTLNRKHRGQDKSTDVLSFRHEEYMGNILGEIFINLQEANRTHKYQELLEELGFSKLSPSRAKNFIFYFLLAHGLLHLIGYNDDSPKERQIMLDLGKKFMHKIAKYGIIKL